MRYSLLVPILLVLGMGCVVREPAYTTGYVEYGYGPAYPMYLSDGYYWSYYGDSWYWWSHDHWVYSTVRPRAPVVISNHNGPGGWDHGHGHGGVTVRDHRDHRSPGARAGSWRGGESRVAPRPRTAPPPRNAPPPSRVRDHRRR